MTCASDIACLHQTAWRSQSPLIGWRQEVFQIFATLLAERGLITAAALPVSSPAGAGPGRSGAAGADRPGGFGNPTARGAAVA